MKLAVAFAIAAATLLAADPKPLPNQAGNSNIELYGTVLIDRNAIQQAVGADIGAGYVVVKMRVVPLASAEGVRAIRVSPDDFTLISSKDGERSSALAPSQIAGSGATLAVRTSPQGEVRPRMLPTWVGGKPKDEDDKKDSSEPQVVSSKDAALSPLLAPMEAKALPDGETKTPVEGLLYFLMEGKLKPKDLSLIYKGPAGRLEIDFK